MNGVADGVTRAATGIGVICKYCHIGVGSSVCVCS